MSGPPARPLSRGALGLPRQAPGAPLSHFPGEAPTVFVGRVDVRAEVQEALQAGQALRLLAGQVQGAALVDLGRGSTVGLAWGPVRLLAAPLPHPGFRAGRARPLPGPSG